MSKHQLVPAAAVLLAVIFGLWFFFWRTPTEKKVPFEPAQVQQQPKNDTKNEKLQLAIVRRGEGIEHALIRQLAASPKEFGFAGDTKDAARVKNWAGREAHVLAIRAGYVDWKFGAEVRVKAPDRVAYVLEKSVVGDLRISQREVAPGGNVADPSQRPSQKVQNITVVGSYLQATFLGNPGNERIRPYEYIYTGEATG